MSDSISQDFYERERLENPTSVVSPLERLYLKRETQDGRVVDFPIEEESAGTQGLLKLVGPWLTALKRGDLICVDELDTHLHPYIMRHLIEMFDDSDLNSNNAQLVFTTHDTSMLDSKIFRRDQVWFCERNRRQESVLYPLSDFKPRKDLENWTRAYLNGRYGAVPFIGDPSQIRNVDV